VSDVDLLVVAGSDRAAADVATWGRLERRVREILGDTPLTMIVHDVHFINRQIRAHNYFFIDILREGVELYNSGRRWLATPKPLPREELLSLAERDFRHWYSSATEFWRGSRYYGARNLLNHAAFLLHQATERYFSAGHLVFTSYKRRTHDLETLSQAVGEQHPLMVNLLPKTEPEDERLFDLLRRAYIDSRYTLSYIITIEELTELQSRVLVLANKIRVACLEKMASFCCPQGVSQDLPLPPTKEEPVLLDFPAPPHDPQELGRWTEQLAAVAAQKAELRWTEGLLEGEAKGELRGKTEGLREGKTEGLREGEAKGELRGKTEGLREGKTEGLREGKTEGLREGEAKGELRGKTEALLLVLRARGIAIPAEVEQRILACSDPALLTELLRRAMVVEQAADLLAS
jgi:HEPN domain-containing protein